MKWIKRGLVVVVFLGLVIFFLFMETPDQEVAQEEEDYKYQVDRPRVVSYSQGEKRWDLVAKTVLEPRGEDREEGRTILRNIKEGQLFKGGSVRFHLDADEIIYYNDSKDATLKGNVKLEEVDGKKITTSHLEWVEKEGKLKTDAGVRVSLVDGELTAKEMVIDIEEDTIDFSQQVETLFSSKGVESDEN